MHPILVREMLEIEQQRKVAAFNDQWDPEFFTHTQRQIEKLSDPSLTFGGYHGQVPTSIIMRTRYELPGYPNIMVALYGWESAGPFSQKQCEVAIIDALTFGLFADRPVYDKDNNYIKDVNGKDVFYNRFTAEVGQPTVGDSFKREVLQLLRDLHSDDPEIQAALDVISLPDNVWKTLVNQVSLVMDIFSPDIMLGYGSGTKKDEIRGWKIVKNEKFTEAEGLKVKRDFKDFSSLRQRQYLREHDIATAV